MGAVPAALPDGVLIEEGCSASQSAYLQDFPGVAAFYIHRGEEIVVERHEGASWDEVRSPLFSVIFAVLMLRRGFLPLHASAVEFAGKTFAFVGDSGAGKSSLVTHLAHRGHRLVADDLTLLSLETEGEGVPPKVTPWAPWVKVWTDVLEGLHYPVDQLDPVPGKEWKRRVPVSGHEQPLPLGGVFLLERAGTEDESRIERLATAKAIERLMYHAYSVALLYRLGQQAELFRRCAWIAERAPVWSFTRPWNLERIGDSAGYLEAYLAACSGRAGARSGKDHQGKV